MAVFKIKGGVKLKGEIIPQGAKNEALQIISCVLLTGEKVTVTNIPEIRDILKLIDLLKDLGVKVERLAQGDYTFEASNVDLDYLDFAQ